MEATDTYNLATAGWLAIQALPLLFTPRLIITLLSPEVHQPTSLEEYFSRSLALSLLALALLSLVLSGAFPLPDSYLTASSSPPTTNPYLSPTLTLTALYHTSTAVYTYIRYNQSGQMGYLLASLAAGFLALFGLWVAMFGGGSHYSRRTGVDKRVGGWPFNTRLNDDKRASAASKPKRF